MSRPQRSQAEQQNPTSSLAAPPEPHVRTVFWVVALVLGLLQVWAHRNDVSPDGISYIEIAEAAGRNGLHALVNGYWSPLYPFLLSLSFRIFHPTPYWEFTAVHFVNFGLYLANLICFEIFLRELLSARSNSGKAAGEFQPVAERIVSIWGYLFFLWSCQFWLSPAMTNPDLCVAGLVYLATALLLRIHRGKGNWFLFGILGAALGVAYLAKAAMFLVSLVFLLSSFFLYASQCRSYRKAMTKTLLACGIFAAVAAPLVIALSKEKHRATFGDSGKIAYAEYVNRATWLIHWQGEPPGTGVPAHPTRKIFSDPAVYEFSQPVPGSYPPWYDPSYWYEGIQPHFSLKGQLWVLFRAANAYLKLFSRSGALYVLFIALFVWVKKGGRWELRARELWWVWLPSLAALGMYALVLVEQRYVSGFALMLLLWILSSVYVSERAGGELGRRVVLATILAPVIAVAWPVARDLKDVILNEPYEPWVVAQQLHSMGISAGTDVGCVGGCLDAYWAHLAGVRVIAEIPDAEQRMFISADSARKQQVFTLFSSVGARVVLTRNREAANPADGWRQIPGTDHFIWEQPLLIAAPERK